MNEKNMNKEESKIKIIEEVNNKKETSSNTDELITELPSWSIEPPLEIRRDSL